MCRQSRLLDVEGRVSRITATLSTLDGPRGKIKQGKIKRYSEKNKSWEQYMRRKHTSRDNGAMRRIEPPFRASHMSRMFPTPNHRLLLARRQDVPAVVIVAVIVIITVV